MSWRIAAAKSIGTSHQLTGLPCQDHYQVGAIAGQNESEIFYCFVSDGAGSAKEGKRGAEIACTQALNFLKNQDSTLQMNVNDTLIFTLVESIIDQISLISNKENLKPRDFACTFLGVIISDQVASYFHIGDGAIVIKAGIEPMDPLTTVFWPSIGEYANMTCFITDADWSANLKIKCVSDTPSEIAVFTDGIQRLCLMFDTHEVFAPFFIPKFSALHKCNSQEELKSFNMRLNDFLNSSQVNDRTDDDKTLVMAILA